MSDKASPAQSPLLRIRAGIEAGSVAEVQAGVAEADTQGVQLAPNVRDMITQWLSVHAPKDAGGKAAIPAIMAPLAETLASSQAGPAPPKAGSAPRQDDSDDEGITTGEGAKGWAATGGGRAGGRLSVELLRLTLLRFFEGAPKGSDAAQGLGIMEGEDASRFLPLPIAGKALGLQGQDFEIAQAVWHQVNESPSGVFTLSSDARGVGLVEWAGWEDFASALENIVAGTRDPAFEPRSIQSEVLRGAKGAVRAGGTRKDDVLKGLKEQLSPQDLPEDAAPALRSAISRRARLALACLVDAIAHYGRGPDAGPDAMGLVGQLPRTTFGLIFDKVDDRDRGACAFLGEILDTWDRRRCFSKKWLADARSKFSIPKGSNSERDEGRGWYALMAANLHKRPKDDPPGRKSEGDGLLPPVDASLPSTSSKAREKSHKEKDRDRDRRRDDDRSGRTKDVLDAPSLTAEQKLAALVKGGAAAEAAAKDTGGKKRSLNEEEDDDDAVARKLEASRKRRAELMQKYKA